jgi:hypothetical protein
MEIKNLSQLKKAINAGHQFVILEHYFHPKYTGHIRKPVTLQTNGFYSANIEDLAAGVPLANYGKGIWCDYGKASEWLFENGECTRIQCRKKSSGETIVEPVFRIKFQ